MYRLNKTLFSCIVMIAATLACTMPSAGPVSSPTPDYIATITAQASSLLIQPTPNNQPPLSENTATLNAPAQGSVTDTPGPTLTITVTASPSIPILTVSEDTNCRSGPSKDYGYISVLLKGKSAEVVGKNTATNYWVVKNPEGSGICWLWGNYATITGDTSKIQEYPIPPTSTPAAPAAPKNLQVVKICTPIGGNYDLSGSISWADLPNENGYRVYIKGSLYNTVPANTITSAIYAASLAPGDDIKIAVEAYNAAGISDRVNVKVSCP